MKHLLDSLSMSVLNYHFVIWPLLWMAIDVKNDLGDE